MYRTLGRISESMSSFQPFGRPASSKAAPSSSDSQKTSNITWLSVSEALIANRCWLCSKAFQKGYRKRIFTISQLLDALVKRRDGIRNGVPTEPLESGNFRRWFDDFTDLLDGDEGKLKAELKKNDVTLWSSGLVCGLSDVCLAQYLLIVPPDAGDPGSAPTGNTSQKSFGSLTSLKDDCPPGCDCANRWPFLSEALGSSEKSIGISAVRLGENSTGSGKDKLSEISAGTERMPNSPDTQPTGTIIQSAVL
jgi:hypothetical protein